jgi:hypothetical protein
MILQNPHSNCTTARLYYYDFLSERTRSGIPESALYHIEDCCNCQSEIERLEVLLAHADENADSNQRQRDSAISTLLRLHFAHAEAPVTCSMVKPFLASLADPVLKLRVPTPITMHIDKCRSCSDDLRTLRDLHLTHKQLCRLGQLLAEEPPESSEMCSKARTAIPAVVSMVLRETNAETLKHLCTCPDCRKHLYRRREAVRQKLPQGNAAQDKFPCDQVSPSDIYECALPYGIDPADDQYAEFRAGLTSHLADCPECLAKVQLLHRTISNIAERTDSNVVTVYHLGESAGDGQRATRNERHSIVDFAARVKRKVSTLKGKLVIGTGLAAAAVILIGLGVLLQSSSATAVSIQQVYSAVEAVRNVHITTSATQDEQWVSQGLNIYLMKSASGWALFDAGTGAKKSKNSLTGELIETQLAEDEIGAIKEKMDITLALMSFSELSGVPRDARWTPVANGTLQAPIASSEVYDLTWSESTSSSVVQRKWRCYVDPVTRLPNRIESYRKRSVETDYVLRSQMGVEYLSDAEMEAVIEKVFP